MVKRSKGQRDTTIKRVCIIKIKKGPKKGKCSKKGYQIGKHTFAHKSKAIKQRNINKRKNKGIKRRG